VGRKQRKGKDTVLPEKGTALDEARDGSAALKTAGRGGGGSTMGNLLTEASLIQAPPTKYIESMFGQRYVASKPKAMIGAEVMARLMTWGFTSRCYATYGEVTIGMTEMQSQEVMLQDWYGLAREMGKRSLKYKHLPTTLTDTDMLIYLLDAYFYVLANLTTLVNLNRLPHFSAAFSDLAQYIPRYMSRITRLWRRLSAMPMPPFIKAHAIRAGQVAYMPGVLAPTVRLWSPCFLLATASGGPTPNSLAFDVSGILTSTANLDTFVGNLETVERWLESGTAAIATDFIAVKDLVDMTIDVVPHAWEPGLPASDSMPGLSSEPGLLTDLLRRAVFRKDVVGAGTDRWILFPGLGMAEFQERIPVAGFGQPSVYDFMGMGAPKFGILEVSGDEEIVSNVDGDFAVFGTDFWLKSQSLIPGAGQDIREVFGSSGVIADEEIVYGPATITYENRYGAWDSAIAADMRGLLLCDTIREMHPWSVVRLADRSAWPAVWPRFVDEKLYGYLMYAEPYDLCENSGEYCAKALGVPFLKGGV
jgi:hypothetical protein